MPINNPCQLCGDESNHTYIRTTGLTIRVLNLCEEDYQNIIAKESK